MKLQSIAIALALVVPALATADDKTPTKPDTKDTSKDKAKKLTADEIKIVSHLHHVNQMEIDLGTFANRVATPPVKKYGQTLITDHTTADKELVTFAKAHGIAVIPAEKADSDADKQAMKDMTDSVVALKKLKGADFDREYLRMMVNDHDAELAKTDGWISTSTDADLDAMLEARKATLQRHSDSAKELQKNGPQATK